MRMTEQWNRLPKEAVGAPSLETFKTCLNAFLCDLLQVILLWQGRWARWYSEVTSTLTFYDSCDIQTSNSKHKGEKWNRRQYLLEKDTSKETDSKTSAMHISLWVTSFYHLPCKYFQPSEVIPSACLESLSRGSEKYPKDVHWPESCFQADHLFHHVEAFLPPYISDYYSKARDQLLSLSSVTPTINHLNNFY